MLFITQHLMDRIRNGIEARTGSTSLSVQRVRKVFEELDRNGDGVISTSEFAKAMQTLKVLTDTD